MVRLPVAVPRFPCTRCGACCRTIGHIPELAAFDRGDDVCVHLREGDEGHACAIYDERPLVCRIDELRPEERSFEDWYRENMDACRWLHLEVYGEAMPGSARRAAPEEQGERSPQDGEEHEQD